MDDSLPPLPEVDSRDSYGNVIRSDADMQAYARAAITADRASRPSVLADRRELAQTVRGLSVAFAETFHDYRTTATVGSARNADTIRAALSEAIDALATSPSGADARDGARYRWLRDESGGQICFDHTEGKKDGNRFEIYVPFDGREIPDDEAFARTFDASVDAAMAPPPAMPKEQP